MAEGGQDMDRTAAGLVGQPAALGLAVDGNALRPALGWGGGDRGGEVGTRGGGDGIRTGLPVN